MNPNFEQSPTSKETPTPFENVVLTRLCKRCNIEFQTFFRAKKRCDVCQPLAAKDSQNRFIKKQAIKRKARHDGKVQQS